MDDVTQGIPAITTSNPTDTATLDVTSTRTVSNQPSPTTTESDIPLDDPGDIIPDAGGNNTSPLIVDVGAGQAGGLDDVISEGNPAVNLVLGLLIVLGSSALNAFGLNLTKLDHMRNASLPKAQRRPDYLRPTWIAGMLAYISSQLFGSTLSLRYLRSDWVAPLGSTSLIFNFLFAKWLVGTPVTKEDVRGTGLIIVAVILILIFSSINHGLNGSITLERLSKLWSRGPWLSYFFFISFFTFFTYLLTRILTLIYKSRESLSPTLPSLDPDAPSASLGGRRKPDNSNVVSKYLKRARSSWSVVEQKAVDQGERWLERTTDERILWLTGVGWAVVGGSLAGACLVFTKAVVKLLTLPGRPFTHPVALVTLFFVALTAVLQIICLNKGLKAADSTLVVPLFYAGYTVLGFVNSLIFLDQAGAYETWVLVAVFLSIALLVAGVVLLSLKKSDVEGGEPPARGSTVSAVDPAMRLNPIHNHARNQSSGGAAASSVLSVARPGATRTRSNSARSPAGRQSEDDYMFSESNGGKAWEIGDISDDDIDGELDDIKREMEADSFNSKAKTSSSRPLDKGERAGLLLEDERER